MLALQSITLTQFRNYVQQQFSFYEKIIGIVGLNGSGKTNLLDAIYYLSFTKSYFGRTENQNVTHGFAGMRIEGKYERNNELNNLIFIVRENNKKEFTVNDERYTKLSDHIGAYPCVMITPDDVELISGSSEQRRKLMDTILAQLNTTYLHALIDYNKLLQQRNSILKLASENKHYDEMLLQIISLQLSEKGNYIYTERKKLLAIFIPMVLEFYNTIAEDKDAIELQFQSQLLEYDMSVLLEKSKPKDFILQRTSMGIHRDDIVFKMNDNLFKSTASQGQRKSLLFALKFAEWQILKTNKGIAPILLLDDIFEKLDEPRMYQLLQWICTNTDTQVFITDTHQQRLSQTLTSVGVQHQLITIEK